MTLTYILSQIFTVIMYALLAVSYNAKKRKAILTTSIAAIIFNGLAYVLLGAWTGLAMCCISFLRSLYSIWDETKNANSKKIMKRDVVVLVVTYIAIILVTIPTYDGFWSLMSVFGTAMYTYSIWQKKPIVYKFFGIPVGIVWTIYNYFVGSFFGVVLEVALLVAAIYGYIKALKAGKAQHAKRD